MSTNKKDDRLTQLDQDREERPEVYGMVKDHEGIKISRRAFFGNLGVGLLSASGCCAVPSSKGEAEPPAEYRQWGQKTLTLPCGSPTPPATTCICDCVAGSGHYSLPQQVCVCDTIMVPAGSPVAVGSTCVCNTIAVGTRRPGLPKAPLQTGHYWYPN